MKNKKIIIFLIFLVSLFLTSGVKAQDLNLTFNEDTCVLNPNAGVLFSELDVKPGDEIVRILEVINDSGEEVQLGIKMTNIKEPALFHKLSEVLDLKIVNNSTGKVIFDQMTMADWKNKTLVFPVIKANELKTNYSFSISMDAGLNNDYQEKEFNFDLEFQCDGITDLIDGEVKGDDDGRNPVEKIAQVLGDITERLPDTGQIFVSLIPSLLFWGTAWSFRRKKK